MKKNAVSTSTRRARTNKNRSAAFKKALTYTGYLLSNGNPAPGVTIAGQSVTSRLRPALSSSRVGLEADAVFSAQNTPVAIFKDAGASSPTTDQIIKWHEAAWNVGLAPLLWIITPTDIRLYNCYASPIKGSSQDVAAQPLDTFSLDSEERLRSLNAMCGHFATETGAFWSSAIGKKIDRRHRVDRELLSEINALEERLTQIPPASAILMEDRRAEIKASRDFAQRLIGRCLFTSYLIDRGIAQPFLPPAFSPEVSNMFGTVDSAFALFRWLRQTFNGDLFPMDDPGAEQQRLSDAHLDLLRDFIEGRSLVPGNNGQGRLFRFRYDAIPVDLISSIYQQFARSSAADKAHVQGLHYTPVELVHLTLDPVFEALPAKARVIDPTCGSGAFLVEAFRRIVWKNTRGKSATRAVVRKILYEQLFGIDINRSALGIAAFSLYLAALELDEEVVTDVADLKFDRLIDKTLFHADTVNDQLPTKITAVPFDAVVGNPPWTFVRQATPLPKRIADDEATARPRRSPDQAFLTVASQLAGKTGRIGMVMKASPFFSKDEHAVKSREVFLRNLAPASIVNLSALRREGLFPDATGPALLFFARCVLMEQKNQLLVGSIPWTPDFRRNGIFQIGPGELKTISLARVLHTPAMLKAATFGTTRDGWLIEKLERNFLTLDEMLTQAGLVKEGSRGQGYQVKGDPNLPPKHYYELSVLTPEVYTPLRTNEAALVPFEHPTLHRPREASIYCGPLLICPKGSFKKAIESGRYSAAVSSKDVLYTESFYGVSFAGRNPDWVHVLSGILNSSLTAFQFAFGGGVWGLERPTVEPNDLLSVRVPNLSTVQRERLQAVADAERAAANEPDNPERLRTLDQAVFDLYELDRDEAVIARESVMRARMFLFEGMNQRKEFIKTPSYDSLAAYAAEVIQVVNTYLRARGKRHLEAVVYPYPVVQANLADGSPGITAVKLLMLAGAPRNPPAVHLGRDIDMEQLTALLRGQVNSDIPPYLNERRHLRIYADKDLLILKPSEVRYWTRTAGINDADVILADHWIKNRNASIA
jgi:hypothetical protein